MDSRARGQRPLELIMSRRKAPSTSKPKAAKAAKGKARPKTAKPARDKTPRDSAAETGTADKRQRNRYSRDISDAILDRIVDGDPVRAATAACGVAQSTWYFWLVDGLDDLPERYKRAMQARAHGLLDELLETANNTSADWRWDEKAGRMVPDHDAIARARLKVDTYKWTVSKLLPKTYGDKVAVVGGGADDAPIKTDGAFKIEFVAPAAVAA
jgi:hypothetical protein